MSEDTLRIGIIGAGGNTRLHHIPKLKAQPGVELVVVANRSVESGQRVADEEGIPNVASHWLEVVEDDTLDAVCIGTWPYLHAPITIAALEAGKHVLCEARMAMNSHEARAMLDTARENPHLIAQIVPAPHTLALDQTIVEMMADGYVGELISVDASIGRPGGFPDFDGALHWRQRRDLSGNNIMSMGIWYEALMRWVGPAATVHAVGLSAVNHRKDEQGRRTAISIPDHIEVLCRLEQGGQMRLNVSTVLGHPKPNRVTIYGTEGVLEVLQGEDGALGLHGGRLADAGLSPISIAPEKVGGWRVEEEFVNAVRGLEPVTHTDFVTGLRYMEWTDAVASSLQSRETVTLPLV